VIPERTDTLDSGAIIGNRLILSYLHDGARTAMVTDFAGRPSRAITLDTIGSASGFVGRPGDPETFYQFSSFNQPPGDLPLRHAFGQGHAVHHAAPGVQSGRLRGGAAHLSVEGRDDGADVHRAQRRWRRRTRPRPRCSTAMAASTSR
jgi:hypothetical protein